MENEKAIQTVKTAPLSAGDMRKQVNIIQDVMKEVMKEGTHFGKIAGCATPSLFKAGAEKLMTTFRLAPEIIVEDLSDNDCARYRVKVRILSASGHFVGEGVGECSSNEEKYKWRAAVCDEEFDETPVDRKREKWKKGYYDKNLRQQTPPSKIKQIRTEPADIANTVLKMAKKRGQIDAVLTATAASDIFTQDIEDLPEGYIDTEFSEPVQKAENVIHYYAKDQFEKNFSSWSKLILSGKKTVEEIITTVESKAPLSDQQKQKLRDVKVAPPQQNQQ